MTLNNYTEDELNNLINIFNTDCKYAVIGKETGESGTPHLQIYTEWNNTKSLNVIKKINNRLHCEERLGTKEQAADYCKKDGDYIEIGELKKMGQRSDLSKVKDAVMEGKNMRNIIDIAPNYQSIRYAETLKKYINIERTWKSTVYWYWGESGTGKSKKVFEETDPNDRWVNMDSLKWWDGYDGQSDIIIDDFRGSDCRLKTLIRVLDRYPFRVEYKGGSTQLLAKRIFITCPYHPKNVYKNLDSDENIQQLLRRIEHIREFTYADMFDDSSINDEL